MQRPFRIEETAAFYFITSANGIRIATLVTKAGDTETYSTEPQMYLPTDEILKRGQMIIDALNSTEPRK